MKIFEKIKNLKEFQLLEIKGLYRVNKTHTYSVLSDDYKFFEKAFIEIDDKQYIRKLKNPKLIAILEKDITYRIVLGFVKIENKEILVFVEHGRQLFKKLFSFLTEENIIFLDKDIKKTV